MDKLILVTGAGGQDGSYLCELLLSKPGYHVTGLVRPSGDGRLDRLANCIGHKKFELVYGDITDPSLPYHIAARKFDEIYLLAAQTQVMQSYHAPTVAFETNALAIARILQSVYMDHNPRVYFAATSEMFGTIPEGVAANEDYPLAAQSPYAAAKVAAHLLCRVYREKGKFVSSGIAFNHESCRRGSEFVTRKVGLGVRAFKETRVPVKLGNLNSRRDWHHAKDTVQGMWLSLQMDHPNEYVFATGLTQSVQDLAKGVCEFLDVEYDDAIIQCDTERRPWDVTHLCGNAIKAEQTLDWIPQYTFHGLIEDICRPKGSL